MGGRGGRARSPRRLRARTDVAGGAARGAADGRSGTRRFSRATGITRAPGPGSEHPCTRARLAAPALPLRLRRSGSAFTRAGCSRVCPLVSLHPGASRWASPPPGRHAGNRWSALWGRRQVRFPLSFLGKTHRRSPDLWIGGPTRFHGVSQSGESVQLENASPPHSGRAPLAPRGRARAPRSAARARPPGTTGPRVSGRPQHRRAPPRWRFLLRKPMLWTT